PLPVGVGVVGVVDVGGREDDPVVLGGAWAERRDVRVLLVFLERDPNHAVTCAGPRVAVPILEHGGIGLAPRVLGLTENAEAVVANADVEVGVVGDTGEDQGTDHPDDSGERTDALAGAARRSD